MPGVSRPILESGPLLLPPADEVLAWAANSTIAAAVHHRAFCLQLAEELGCALPGAQMVGSLPDSTDSSPPRKHREPGCSKPRSPPPAAIGISKGTGPRIVDPRSRRRVERLFDSHGPLLFEPWMNRTADFGVSALLDPSGLRIVGIHGQRVDVKGQFAGIDLQPILSEAERARLLETAESVGAALRRKGYTGPFGIDAWRYRKESGEEILHPLGEINARMTFGLVAWALAERVEGATLLRFGRQPAGGGRQGYRDRSPSGAGAGEGPGGVVRASSIPKESL